MGISVNEIRKDFPLLENQKVIYLDTAATSQKPACVLEAEREFYEKYNANPLRGLYELGEAATEKYEEARETVRGFMYLCLCGSVRDLAADRIHLRHRHHLIDLLPIHASAL